MKRAFTVSLVLVLLASALFWMCPLVLANLTLTVASRPGGSVKVSSNAFYAVTLGPGEQQSWSVPSGTRVTLEAVDFASGFEFSNWDGPFYWPDNFATPLTFTVQSSTSITANFNMKGAPNALSVSLSEPRNRTYNTRDVAVSFEVANPTYDSSQTNIQTRVTVISFYLDGEVFYGAAEPQVVRASSLNRFWYNSTLYGLGEGEHSLFVAAVAQFEVISGVSYWGTSFYRSPGSGVSGIVYFVVDSVPPSVPEPSPSEEPSNSEPLFTGPVFSAAIIASAAAVSFGLVAYFLRRKKRSPP